MNVGSVITTSKKVIGWLTAVHIKGNLSINEGTSLRFAEDAYLIIEGRYTATAA